MAILVGYAALTLVLRTLPLTNNIGLLIAVSAPYAVLIAAAGVVVAVLGHRVLLSVIAMIVLATSLGVQLNWHYGKREKSSTVGAEMRVLSANLRKGRADVSQVVEIARSGADVLTLSELTPDWVRQFYATGIRDTFPHSVLLPAPDAGGIGIWSRYPLEVIKPLKSGSMVAARAAIPGLPRGAIVAAVHIINPLTFYGKAFAEWRRGIETARARMGDLADAAGSTPVVVAGDFNSTPDMRQFRELLSHGYRDAASQIGAGWSPTFPATRWIPPLIAIDHVLIREAQARQISTIAIGATDHRAVLATIGVPTAMSQITENRGTG
ncbi:endonuclease/exonuclease/phosphatase family protein [Mycolicibacterium vaccae]|uniref:endonuclease/exonuclease/phosphatase family protein n=1 Tax=Mycolicibacterium vaccae TaxID=1810 RepID=UPI003CEF0CD6